MAGKLIKKFSTTGKGGQTPKWGLSPFSMSPFSSDTFKQTCKKYVQTLRFLQIILYNR